MSSTRGRGSVLLWRRCDMVCSSSVSWKLGRYLPETSRAKAEKVARRLTKGRKDFTPRHILKLIHQGTAPGRRLSRMSSTAVLILVSALLA